MDEVTEKPPLKPKSSFACECCDYKCSKNSEYIKHLLTAKHIGNASGNAKSLQIDYQCDICDKIYKSRKGLWSHKKTCTTSIHLAPLSESMKSSDDVKILNSIVIELIKSNTELQKQLVESYKNNSNNTMINSHNNSHNKTFNLQIFLNEQCKDAMNMSEFVESFELKLEDLESVGELGYVDGMTKIFVDKLNSMDIYKRPMHCSDAKRETLYIKDEDRWEREKPSNPKLRKAVRNISFKNMKLVNLWSDTYPESKCNESRLNDVYMKIVIQSTGGSGEIGESEDKIMKRITKGIVIDKSSLY
jgi:hypothetical protein